MKLAINLALSFGMLALCAVARVAGCTRRATQLAAAFDALRLARRSRRTSRAYLGLLVVVQLCRSLRWNYLLAPLGVRIPTGPLLAISSVGFMAILALPARLGEFVRPGLLRKRGVSASAALGTVAVERIVDGLLVSLFVFGAFFALRGPDVAGLDDADRVRRARRVRARARLPRRSRCKLARADRAVLAQALAVAAVRAAHRRGDRAQAARHDPRLRGACATGANLAAFIAWSIVYWVVQRPRRLRARARRSASTSALVGAFATMGLVAVGITLPNSPGLVGQFQWFTLLGLSLYIPGAATKGSRDLRARRSRSRTSTTACRSSGTSLCGALGLATRWVSFHDLWDARPEKNWRRRRRT